MGLARGLIVLLSAAAVRCRAGGQLERDPTVPTVPEVHLWAHAHSQKQLSNSQAMVVPRPSQPTFGAADATRERSSSQTSAARATAASRSAIRWQLGAG